MNEYAGAITPAERDRLRALAQSRVEYRGLPGEFYWSEMVYRADMEAVWRRGWIFVGHTCQIPQSGDFFTVQVDREPLLIVRGNDQQIRAFYNICRHRGTLLSTETNGNARRFICPYHQWVYSCRGDLESCRGMPDDTDTAVLGLTPVALQALAGMLFISLAPDPCDFQVAADAMAPFIHPQGLDRAKVATIVDYEVATNWKVIWENNRECYHCNVNHPQYIRANYDHFNEDDTSASVQARMAQALARSQAKWASAELTATHHQTGMATFPDADRHLWYAANRTVLAEGYVSESMDGRQVAPLMGDYVDPDVGTLRVRTLPNMWNHSSCDHAVTTRLLPAGPESTRIQVTWLVHENAVEGVDYQLDQLLPFWKLTSEQDWELCERVQRGVRSTGYRPGPLSRHKEYNVEAFLRWYSRCHQA